MEAAKSGRPSRPAPRGTAAYKRRRAVTACQVCRARRTKCDNRKPSCSFCLKTGATCIQSPEDLSSFDPASLKILESLDGLKQLITKSLSANADREQEEEQEEEQDQEQDQDEESPRKVRVISTATHCTAQRSDHDSCAVDVSMVVLPSCEQVLRWSCFQDIIIGSEEPENWDGSVRHDGAASLAQQGQAAVETTPLAGGLLSALEEPQQIKILLDRFFAYIHVKNPILDEAATRKMVLSKAVDDVGFDWSPDSCLALLICALGSLSTPFGPSTDTMPGTAAYSSAHALFRAAQKRLGLLMASEGIVGPQCFFLAGVFTMCNFQPVKAWRYFVQAVVECQQFRFLASRPSGASGGGGGSSVHLQDQDTLKDQDTLQDTLQQAVYWSAWKSERELRGDVRHPDFLASDHDGRLYPPFFPTPPAPRADVMQLVAPLDDADHHNQSRPEQSREHVSWYFYLAEISLRRLSVRMSAEMMDMTHAHASSSRHDFLNSMAAALPSYEAQAGEWLASLPPCLLLEGTEDQDDVCRFVLRGHLINLYEAMYWPFLAAVLDLDDHGSRVRARARTRTRAAGAWESKFIKQAQRGLNNHMDRLLVNRAGYWHRHHGTDLLLRSCARSALILLAVSRSNEAARDGRSGQRPSQQLSLPDGWENQVRGVVALLDFWAAETRAYDDCRRVLRQGVGVEIAARTAG